MPEPGVPTSSRPRLRRSLNTRRALREPRPRLRGSSHLIAALVSVPGALWWTATVPAGRPRAAVGCFAGGVAVMFLCSALLHLRPWSAAAYERWFRLDHSGIYLAIAGTGVAVGLLGLQGWPRTVLVTTAVIGAAAGIVLEWLPFPPPRGSSNAIYLTLGWSPVLLLPWMWRSAGPSAVALLLLGGLLYTAGAVIVGIRRPGRRARWFGYHEWFHLLVILAVAVHGTLVASLVP